MRFRAAAALAALCLAGSAPAAEPPELPDSLGEDRTSVAVTVYNANVALVRETRSLDVTRSGISRLRFMDVPSSIDPRTVHLRDLGKGGLAVLEQNYEYDLISPDKLLEKYVGREVEIVEQADDLTTRSVRAELLSVNGGPVYRIGDRIVLNQHGKVTLSDVPPDLVPRPTLVWTVDAPRSGRREVEASYLTSGMTWSADYVAVVDEDDASAGITGWVTVENKAGATFRDATLKLVAGDVRRVEPYRQEYTDVAAMELKARAPSPQFAEESFFEYHLYTLERPTTLKDRQTKQITLLQAEAVPLEKKLLLVGQPAWFRNAFGTVSQDQKVAVVLELVNEEAGGLGVPLPKGTVRVYKKDRSGAEQFVGEDSIDHTPRDERIKLHVGDAFDVVADRKQTDFKRLSPSQSESAFEISVRNRKDEDITVIVREPVGGDWTLLSSSLPGKKLDTRTIEFEVPVPKRKEVKLTYRVRVSW